MSRWYIKMPLDAYALGPIEADDYEDALEYFLAWLGVDELPEDAEIWSE
jgi:hypothetical protein